MMLDRECIMIVINLEQPRGLMVGRDETDGSVCPFKDSIAVSMDINLSVNRRGMMDT